MEGLEAFYSTVARSISCPQDAVVCFVHWGIIRNGYKCLGSGDEPGGADKRSELLPADWNNNSELYTLRYQDREGVGLYLLKAQTVADAVVINLINSDTLRDSDLTVRIGDHADAEQLQSFDRVYKDVDGLAEKVRTQLLSPQEPPKEAPQKPPQKAAAGGDDDNVGRGYDERRDRDYTYPGGYSSPWRPPYAAPHRASPPQWPPTSGHMWPDVGSGDLDPLNPLGSGMLMDPRNAMPPRFSPYGGIPSPILPPGAVPPGARYDPFGPPEPEPDHLHPPGYEQNPRPRHGPRFDPSGRRGPRPGPPGPEFS